MHPKLFDIGPVPVYSYGLMLGLAFLLGSYLFTLELRRKKVDENIGITITFLAIIGGIVGGKIFYVIEEWNFGKGLPLSELLKSDILSPAGLTFYGGVILAIIIIIIYCRFKRISVMMIFDSMAPGAAIAYGVARIGCHLSGDGCYGISVNNTPWEFLGMEYSKGIVPTKVGELVHPTPLYELGAAIIIFTILWIMRKKIKYNGALFYYYLILIGIPRLLVEFIRRNPKVIFGLTQAQLISIILIAAGIIMLIINRKKFDEITVGIDNSLVKNKRKS
ncbi:MAG: prolipoprotein diacylglyceryl transferase [Ignavibacteria bacterium]|nr:prolipoprotein diacylglyceryl transferase [Ignavibacteria bacterium]